MTRVQPPFDIKNADISGLALVLRTADLALVAAELETRVHDAGDLFANAPVLLDVSALPRNNAADGFALGALVDLLSRHTMRTVGIVGAAGDLLAQALAMGLLEQSDIRQQARRKPANRQEPDSAPATAKPVAGAVAAPTMVIDKPLRSGQRVYARGCDLVVLGVVSHGAEVIADGHIHVYGPLRGRAIAGAGGDVSARIFAACMEPELISIAGNYRTADKPLGAEVQGKPAQARLEGEKLLIEPLRN